MQNDLNYSKLAISEDKIPVAVRNYFEGKKILITGGTGTFGQYILNYLLACKPNLIKVFSRDEAKQYALQMAYGKRDDFACVLGDVRNLGRLCEAMAGVDVVFHAAALKQVPNCEMYPIEAVMTNVVGAENVRQAALQNSVEAVLAISTDKAVKPVNVMGMSKALQERILLNPTGSIESTRFIVVRYGNVLGSRSSVIPLFRQRLDQGLPLHVTNKEMTRFILTLSDAVDLVFKAIIEGGKGDVFVKKAPSVNTWRLAEVMASQISGRSKYPIEEVGSRSGEKIHEVLVSEEEMSRTQDLDGYFKIWPHDHYENTTMQAGYEYTSQGTHVLTDEQLADLLRVEKWI